MKLHLIIPALFVAGTALAQEPQPPLKALIPIIATDASRMANELTLLMKMAEELEAKTNYWKDACQSTPECGGGAVKVGQN